MAKRRIKFELAEIRIAGLKFEIEDELEQATAIFAAVQNQIAGVIQPAVSKALTGAAGTVVETQALNDPQGAHPPARKPRRKLSASAPAKPGEASTPAITYSHDHEKVGSPQQGWTMANKAVWLLWAVEQANSITELGGYALAELFNLHFKQFGIVHPANVRRDLGKLRTKNPPLVGTDPNRSPQVWFLTTAGKAHGERLAKSWDGKGA